MSRMHSADQLYEDPLFRAVWNIFAMLVALTGCLLMLVGLLNREKLFEASDRFAKPRPKF